MVTTICPGFQWKHWRKTMGKTFEEWYSENGWWIENNVQDQAEGHWADLEKYLKLAWDASRENMTTRDI